MKAYQKLLLSGIMAIGAIYVEDMVTTPMEELDEKCNAVVSEFTKDVLTAYLNDLPQ